MARKNIAVVVTAMRQLTPRMREYRLTAADGQALPAYEPGSHIALHTDSSDGSPLVRHYFLLGGTEDGDDPRHTYRIAVQNEDRARGSAHIHATFAPGTRLQVAPPGNNFPLDRRDAHSLLIAGGIGITPIFSMARSLARRHREFSVVYAGRTPGHMALREALERIAGTRVRFHYSDLEGPPNSRHCCASNPCGILMQSYINSSNLQKLGLSPVCLHPLYLAVARLGRFSGNWRDRRVGARIKR